MSSSGDSTLDRSFNFGGVSYPVNASLGTEFNLQSSDFIFYYELMNNAAREGARYAIVHGSDAVCPSGPLQGEDLNDADASNSCDFAGTNVKQRVSDAAISIASLGEIVVHQPVWTDRADLGKPSPGDANSGSTDRGNYVTVFVDFSYRPLVGAVVEIPVLPEITISAESTLVINY